VIRSCMNRTVNSDVSPGFCSLHFVSSLSLAHTTMSSKGDSHSYLPPPSPIWPGRKGAHHVGASWPRRIRRTITRAPLALLVLAALASYTLLYRAPSLDYNITTSNRQNISPFSRPDVPDFLPQSQTRNPAILVKAKHGAVATEFNICSETGVGILKAGGNAIDAGIASTLCIGVASMYSCVMTSLHDVGE
jgi:hypothetical protein